MQGIHAEHFENIMRHHGAFGELLAFLHEIALKDDDVFANRNHMLLFLGGRLILHDDRAFAADNGSEVHHAIDAGNLGRVFRLARLEQFRHPRQTASDVFGLGSFAWRLGQQRTGLNGIIVAHLHVRAGGDGIIGNHLLLRIFNDDLRMQIFFVLDDDHGILTGGFIHLHLHRHAFDDIVEADASFFLGKNRHVVRIPLHEGFTGLDLFAIGHGDHRTDGDVVGFQFGIGLGIAHDDRAVFVEHNVAAIPQIHNAETFIVHHAGLLGLDFRLLENRRGRTADVEGAHGELSTRLANGLRSDDAHCLAQLSRATGGVIAAVTMRAHALLVFAGEHGAHFDFVDAGIFNGFGVVLIEFHAGLDEFFSRVDGVDNVIARVPSLEAVSQMHDFLFAFVYCLNPNTVSGAAV